jgi:hypothetical protein
LYTTTGEKYMIEAMKQALDAFHQIFESTPVYHNDGTCIINDKSVELSNKAIASLQQAIAEAEDNYQGSDAAKAAHMMDLYTALGVRWGDNPFAVIAKMRSIAELESQEPVAWRTFDGEGQYEYRAYEENESYADDWNKRNPNHKGWVEPLYTHPPQRKPLTDGDFLDWYDSAIWGNEDFEQCCQIAFEAGWQFAHGIKE